MAEELKERSRHRHHTTLYSNFFLLRTKVVIDRQQAVVQSDREGGLALNCRYPEVGVTFDSLVTDVNEILERHGMEAVTEPWCEEVPLFKIKVFSNDDLMKLISLERKIKRDLAARIDARMTVELQSRAQDDSAPPPRLHVKVEVQVLLLIPNYDTKDGTIIQVTKDNVPLCMALFLESEVFDFGALFRASHISPTLEDYGKKMYFECQINVIMNRVS